MERVEHLSKDAQGGGCVILGGGRGPLVDLGRRPSTEPNTRWFVSERAVKAMARVLDLPSARDVETLERENEALTRQVAVLEDQLAALNRVLDAHRRVLGLDGVPSTSDLDAAEAVVRSFTVAPDEPAAAGVEAA